MPKQTLNSAQKQAVEHTKGPLLIVAGAGTGKTTVITKKIAHLIEKKLAKPEEILALTFTDKAAGEMEERVDDLLFNLKIEEQDINKVNPKDKSRPARRNAVKPGYVDLQISTFHAFCQRLLEEYGVEMGLPSRFKLLSQTDAWLLMRENIYDFNLDYYRPMGNPTGQIHALLNHFSKCKDELISTQDYLDYVESLILDKDEAEIQEKNRSIEIADAYHKYNQLLLDNNALDFGDLIFYTVKLLRDRPNILKKLQERFKYILVDEFQDVNWAQYELIKLLADVAQLTVVGDDDQCLPGNTKIHTPNGNVEIKKLKKGDLVTTAVGKGYYTTSFIKDLKKLNKKARFAEITTESGKKITVTDNHIMFVNTPNTSDKKTYYVYIMRRKGWGWRMGITNDLAVRLRLERGADGIIAIKSCETEAEARFYETIYCLKYNIPTICFKERDGVVQNKEWLKRVFDNIDTEKNIQKLAKDLYIDLNVYHVVLDAVNRGEMRRIKINVTSCYRKYGKKDNKRGTPTSRDKNYKIQSPVIQHLLQIETTDKKTIDILRHLGHNMTKAKKGFRFRKVSQSYQELENIAKQISLVTGGIIDRNFKIAQGKHKVLKSIMMPAKNVMPGLFVPVFHEDKGLFYEKVKDVKYFEKKQMVYDLEIEKTHNFIANNIAVHNSIYSFRGSNVSIIMRFKEDFKNADEIVLTENYRSAKEILDFAYESIKHNNPDRLEKKLKINKKLEAKGGIKNGEVEHLHFQTLDDEVQGTVKKIIELRKKDKDATLDDFAILVRANSHVEPFLNAFEAYNIPYEYLASSGLYRQPIVLDCVNFLNIIENIHNDKAIYRLLRMPFLDFKEDDLQKLTGGAKKKSISYYEACKRAREFFVSPVGIEICQKLISLIHDGMKNARVEKPTVVLYQFLENSGYLKYLAHEETVGNREVIRQIYHIKQFFNLIEKYEEAIPGAHVAGFVDHYNQIVESGDNGKMVQIEDTPDSVNIITVHSAKGLEYKYVFVVNCVEERLPTRKKSSGIEIPSELIKENLPSTTFSQKQKVVLGVPEGDFHYQEERRLFYVACTRAKQKLFLTSADDYGGVRKKKLSRFLVELELGKTSKDKTKAKKIVKTIKQCDNVTMSITKNLENKKDEDTANFVYNPPKRFSFSQINSYNRCPYQYKLSHVLKIPMKGSASFSFGNTIHNTLQKFYERIQELNNVKQDSLFGLPTEKQHSISGGIKVPKIEELLEIYESKWIADWYDNKKQREEYFKKGKEILKVFYASQKDNPFDNTQGKWTIPVTLEGFFKIKIGEFLINGRIDRIDQLEDGTLEIIDYKTGKGKEKLSTDDKQQLLIYQIATQTLTEYKNIGEVSQLTFYYINDNLRQSFIGKDKDIEKLQEKLLDTMNNIKDGKFKPTPSQHVCSYCEYKEICEFRKL